MAEPLTRRADDAGLEPLLCIADLMELLRCGRSTIERMRSSGCFPTPDRFVGKLPRWKRATIRRWLDEDQAKGGHR